MAGSYRHVTNENNEFIGIDLIENLGDAYEALEDCYKIIKYLGGTKEKIYQCEVNEYKESFPGEDFPFSFDEWWSEE